MTVTYVNIVKLHKDSDPREGTRGEGVIVCNCFQNMLV